jgi:hypothetical protein
VAAVSAGRGRWGGADSGRARDRARDLHGVGRLRERREDRARWWLCPYREDRVEPSHLRGLHDHVRDVDLDCAQQRHVLADAAAYEAHARRSAAARATGRPHDVWQLTVLEEGVDEAHEIVVKRCAAGRRADTPGQAASACAAPRRSDAPDSALFSTVTRKPCGCAAPCQAVASTSSSAGSAGSARPTRLGPCAMLRKVIAESSTQWRTNA